MSVDINKVIFYKSKDFQGDSFTFTVGDSVDFPEGHPDNDKFMSCQVGRETLVNCYQNNDLADTSADLFCQISAGAHPNISTIGGLSKFQVISNSHIYGVDVKVVSKIPNDKANYDLTLEAPRTSVKTNSSNTKYAQCPIADTYESDMTPCKVIVRNSDFPWSVVDMGVIYFSYNKVTGLVKHTLSDGFPSKITVTQEGKTNFCFNIESLQ
eukprot:gene16943-20155_t